MAGMEFGRGACRHRGETDAPVCFAGIDNFEHGVVDATSDGEVAYFTLGIYARIVETTLKLTSRHLNAYCSIACFRILSLQG